jgi:hypothetical protein
MKYIFNNFSVLALMLVLPSVSNSLPILNEAEKLFSVFSQRKLSPELLENLQRDAQSLQHNDPRVLTVLSAGIGTSLISSQVTLLGIYGLLIKSYSGIFTCVAGRAASLCLIPTAALVVPGLALAFFSKEAVTLASDSRYQEIRKKIIEELVK